MEERSGGVGRLVLVVVVFGVLACGGCSLVGILSAVAQMMLI